MCAVSMITDWGKQQVSPQQWTRDTWSEYQEIIKKLDELDKKLGLKECEDPAKALWMEQVEKRLKKLEGKNDSSDHKS